MSDNGTENNTIKKWITKNKLSQKIQHLIAQKDTTFSNSMVEAGNKHLKYNGLYRQAIPDFATLQKVLPTIQQELLHKPLHGLNGRTPYEVLHNIPYPKTDKDITIITPSIRIKTNKQLQCCNGYSF